MEKLQSITIENNEQYLRKISKKVNITDPELHNNIVVLQNYCMQNDVMAMAAVQLGIPKRIVYVKNTNLDILNKRLTDEGKEVLTPLAVVDREFAIKAKWFYRYGEIIW